jgi:L-xylulokinase
MFADVLQIPIEITEATELGALGAAICAAVGSGEYQDAEAAVAGMVKTTRVVEPDKTKAEIYTKKYERYLEAAAALDGYWKE